MDDLIKIRRHLHANPEPSLQEYETANYIEQQLHSLGLETQRIAETGVVALIEGEHPGPTLGFRADIDALPIQEKNARSYKSRNAGVMHACGHDVHTTIALGIAEEAIKKRNQLHGKIKLIFQPAEEASPIDSPIGAEQMVQEGVLENPKIDAMFALHCMPTLDVGKIGYTGGPVWASSDLVEISIEGKKTHAAYPHEGIDATLIASQLVVALQTITSRRIDARQACVLSFGKMESGNTYNVISDHATLTGILRTLSPETEHIAKIEIQRIVSNLCTAFGGKGVVKFTAGARLTENNIVLEQRFVSQLRTLLGNEALVPHLPQLGAEDFSAFSNRVPSCYLFLGVRNEKKGIINMIHTPEFDVDESCIPFATHAISTALFSLAAEGLK